MPCNAPGIECESLSRAFGKRQALSDLRLQVPCGTLAVMLGSNGAGKTTLMKILATLLHPDRGRASILGQDVVHRPEAVRRLLGYVPAEERSFYGRLTVLQNLEFFAALRGLSRRQCRDKALGLLAALRLEDHLQVRFAELSSGMKQSLALVRGLLHDPPVLILDEPTRSLSPDLAHRVQELLLRLAHDEGKAILLATHNLGEAESLCDQLSILQAGRILAQGPPADLCRQHGIADGPARMGALFSHFTRTPAEVEL